MIRFDCIGHKKDLSGKIIIWGIAKYTPSQVEHWYVISGTPGKAIYKYEISLNTFASTNIDDKIKIGYKFVNVDSVNVRWPTLIKEIEELIILDKLTA